KKMFLFVSVIIFIGCSTPQRHFIYVTSTEDKVTVVDMATRDVITTVPVKGGPSGITVSEDGNRVYVVNFWKCSISTIDAETNAVISELSIRYPWGIAIKPRAK
ncbi:MAG: cytochrome D1 domain-containing protein, partial [Planctomycetota bacterium]